MRLNLESLGDFNHDLQRLLGLTPVTAPGGRAKRLVGNIRFLRGDYTHAFDIYNALCNGYKCACETPHLANLKLSRLDSVDQLPDDSGSDDVLELLFSIDEPPPQTAVVEGDTSPGTSDEDAGCLRSADIVSDSV